MYREYLGQAVASRVYYKAHLGWRLRLIFIIKVLRWLENAVLRFVFAKSMLHKRDILLLFEAEFTESVVEASCTTCFFVSISLWHFEARHNNLMLQSLINPSFYKVFDRRFLNHDNKPT